MGDFEGGPKDRATSLCKCGHVRKVAKARLGLWLFLRLLQPIGILEQNFKRTEIEAEHFLDISSSFVL